MTYPDPGHRVNLSGTVVVPEGQQNDVSIELDVAVQALCDKRGWFREVLGTSDGGPAQAGPDGFPKPYPTSP